MKVREILREEERLRHKIDDIYAQCLSLSLANPHWNKLEQAIRDWCDFLNKELN